MAPLNNTSFIPKSPRPGAGRSHLSKRIYVLSYVSYVLFFSALIVVVAVYVYSSLVDKKLTASKEELSQQQQRFSQAQLEEVRDLEKKMLLASDLLEHSTAPSKLFTELEGVVSDRVAFTGADFKLEDNEDLTYEFSGVAKDFNDVIYQRDMFNRSQTLASSELATYDYSLDNDSEENSSQTNDGPTIAFTFSSTIPGSMIAYEPVVREAVSTSTEVVSEPRATEPAAANEDSATSDSDQNN